MPAPKTPTKYRTLMQRLALKRFAMSPKKRIEQEAVRLTGGVVAAGAVAAQATTPTPPTAATAPSPSASASTPVTASTPSPPLSASPADATGTASAPAPPHSPADPSGIISTAAFGSLRRFVLNTKYAALPNFQAEKVKGMAEQLGARVRTAMHATAQATHRAMEGHAVDPSTSTTPAETARGVMRSHRRSYASTTPFDDRWDAIMKNLAVLGVTSTGNTVVPYPDSGDAFEAMWREVDAAKKEVLWQTYICKDDYVGQRTVAKLAQAHRRGCQTELLYDCGGNISGRSRLTEELRQCGAHVIPYRPFFSSTFRYLTKLDWKISPGLRNHRKILLVDGRIGFCGGLNIGKEYCGTRMGGSGTFRDTHCSVVGPAVEHLRVVYDDTKRPQPWKYGWTRFRQIASLQVERRVQQSTDVLDTNKQALQLFQETTASMTRSSRVYFHKQLRRAERGIYPMIGRMGLRKQEEEKVIAMMEYYKKRLVGEGGEKGGGTKDGAPPQLVPGEEIADAEKQASTVTAESAGDGDARPQTEGAEAERASLDGMADEPETGATAAASAQSPPLRSRAMKRKMRDARVRSLYKATNLAHKRAYTSMILSVPIEDSEPVPEAALYNELRPSTTQILSCNPRFRNYSIQYAFWQVTRKCHRRIWITTPYYLPTRKLFKAMLQAAKRGVDVRLLAGSNQTTDPWFMWHASNHITQTLLRAGVRIYEFKGSQVMHGKTVVVDSIWSSIGSYNWDVMSNKNLEVCLCHLDADVARQMETQFSRDLAESEEVKLELHAQRSLWLRFTSWLFYNGVFLMDRITFRSFTNQDVEDSPDIPRD